MVLEEALRAADEADKEGYLNRYPQACIRLAWEVRRLQRLLKRLKEPEAPVNPCAEVVIQPFQQCVLPHELPEDEKEKVNG